MKDMLRKHLELFLADNCQAWVLDGDGRYERLTPGKKKRISAQDIFLEQLTAQT
jgi:polyphosphate kinase